MSTADFAKIAAPLNLLLRKGETPQLYPLSSEQVTAFDTLRDALINPLILVLQDRNAPLDGSKQIIVPLSLRPLLLEHFPVVAWHPGVLKM
jgi:hypothetical protein